MKKSIGATIAALALLLTGCASANAPADLIGIHYTGGVASAKKFVDCLAPSTRSGYDPGDSYFFYPVRQISYEASSDASAERGRFTVVSEDSAELYVPVRLTFQLDTECETLRKFHEEIGSRYSAYIPNEGDATSADYPDGWVDLLNDIIGKPLDNTLVRIAQQYPWRDVWNDDAVRIEMQAELQRSIEQAVNAQAGGDFFTDFTVLVQKPDPVDSNLVQAIADEQAGIAQARAAEAKADADVATAKAQERLALAEARAKEAEIEGFGGVEAYLRYLCVTTPTCGNPFRDQLLYGGQPTQ